MKKSHLLINGLNRCGGSLIARLFDGHSNILSMPIEMHYSYQRGRWPDLSVIKALDIDQILKELGIKKTFYHLHARKYISKDLYFKPSIDFDYDEFCEQIKKYLEQSSGTDHLDDIIHGIVFIFWEYWQKKTLEQSTIKMIVNHLAMMYMGDPSFYFNHFSKGFIVHNIRDVRAWYASVCKGRDLREETYFMLPSVMIWMESVLRALEYSSLFPDQYFLIRYEDYVLDAENSMKQLCEKIDIFYDSCLTVPTMGEKEWGGNSSFGVRKGIEKTSLSQWKKVLSSSDVSILEEWCRDFMVFLGYENKSDMNNEDISIKIPFLNYEWSHTGQKNHSDIVIEQQKRNSLWIEYYYERILKSALKKKSLSVNMKIYISKIFRLLKKTFK